MVKLKVGAGLLALGVIILSVHAVRRFEWNLEAPAIVPLPQHIRSVNGRFELKPTTCIVLRSLPDSTAELLAARLRQGTGYAIPLRLRVDRTNEVGSITLDTTDSAAGFGPEGYEVDVSPERVTIRAKEAAGLFYGTQTLLQLLPVQIFSETPTAGHEWSVPCLRIRDEPRFPWRGLMIDVSRHFFNGAEIKQILDVMALHKLNIFHWHLTDDQGWRIEIQKYPLLTQTGAWRKSIGFNLDPKASTAYDSKGRYGGFYTQSEIRDIVGYAQARFITIVPEIDMPGHSSAALAAYPQYSCTGGPYTTDMAESVASGVYCVGKEETFQFLEGVLSEVMNLFPGPYLHVGGDEVNRASWRKCPQCQARMAHEGCRNESELEGYFLRRIEGFVNAHGKRMIGWSEILNGQLAQSTVLMDWIGGGLEAAQAGRDTVMSPEEYCYLDLYQSRDRANEPPAAGAYLPLKKVYQFEPVPKDLALEKEKHILGAQANVWTEYIPSRAQLEYMVFPRLIALAEVVWSPKNSRNWQDFNRRLPQQEQRLDELGVRYRR